MAGSPVFTISSICVEKDEIMNGDAFKALLALMLQQHNDMSSADICKSAWAMATLRPDSCRSVTAALSNTWLKDHLETASLLDNSQMMWALGSLYSRSNDSLSLDTVTALLRKCREQIAEGNREKEDIEKYASA
jgi:hypothetical protein